MQSLGLAIQTYPGGNDALKRNWGHFLRAGANEITIITTTCGGCWIPDKVNHEMIGANLYCVGAHLALRLLRTIEFLIERKHDWLAIAEYDVLFFKEIPRDLPKGLTAHLAGHKMPGHHCEHFYHGPWIMDRDTGFDVLHAGYELIAAKTVDSSPDCFLGQIIDKTGIPVHTDILKSYSRNTIHGDVWTAEARAAVDAGAVCVHGVKDPATFNALTK